MAQTATRSASINIRAQRTQRDLIDKAAAKLHKNRSDFMLEAACREAQDVLLDVRLFLVNDADYRAFDRLLRAPTKQNRALRKLLSKKTPWGK